MIKNKEGSKFKILAKCDPKKTAPEYQTDDKNQTLLVLADGNCGVYLPIAEFLHKNKWIISILLIVLGIVLLFFGGSKWDSIFTVIGFVVGAGGMLVFLFGFVEMKQTV